MTVKEFLHNVGLENLVGRQIRFKHGKDLYQGRIKTVVFGCHNNLLVEFAWLSKSIDPNNPKTCCLDASFKTFKFDLTYGTIERDSTFPDRIIWLVKITDVRTFIFPPDDPEFIDPLRVIRQPIT